MNGYEQVLVVLLSSALAVFLILGIVLLVLLIKVVCSVKRVTEKAEHFADKAEAAAEFFQHAAGPMALGRAFTTIFETVTHRGSSKQGKKGKG